MQITEKLYRELHYQMILRNPVLTGNEEKLKKALKRISIKRNLALNSFNFLIFGSFIASGLVFITDEKVFLSFAVALVTISFIFSLYVTAVQSPYIVSLGIFEPLKTLPIRVGGAHLSKLLLIDAVPGIVIALPTAIILFLKNPIAAILLLLWVLLSIFIGHTAGLFLFSTLGFRISQRRTRINLIKNFIKIFGIIVFMSFFYTLSYMQKFLATYSNSLAPLYSEYSLVFPFSSASLFQPFKSFVLLLGYVFIFAPLYSYSVRNAWRKVLEPDVLSDSGGKSIFKASFGNPIAAMTLKDIKVISRRSSAIFALLIPLYFVLPQIFLTLRTGIFPFEHALSLISVSALFSIIGSEVILKIESKEIDFLKTLPVTKRQFTLSKSLSMAVFPVLICIGIVSIGCYFNPQTIFLLPLAVMNPINVSLLTMTLLFRYKGDEIGIPEKGFLKSTILFTVNGLMIGITVLPVFLMQTYGIILSWSMATALMLLMLKRAFQS